MRPIFALLLAPLAFAGKKGGKGSSGSSGSSGPKGPKEACSRDYSGDYRATSDYLTTEGFDGEEVTYFYVDQQGCLAVGEFCQEFCDEACWYECENYAGYVVGSVLSWVEEPGFGTESEGTMDFSSGIFVAKGINSVGGDGADNAAAALIGTFEPDDSGFWNGPCSGVTPYTTDQIVEGIGNTDPGGTLCLTAGTYSAAQLSITKQISIVCTAPGQACILDGGNGHRVVYVNAGGSNAVSLTGLKITRGSSGNGAGVYIGSGSVTMTDCFISDNDAPGAFGGNGGGVFVDEYGSATLVNCELEGNSATYGGGLSVNYGAATLYGCTFTDNTASNSGADIYNNGGTVTVNGDGEGYSDCTQGDPLDTGGTIIDPDPSFSYTECTTVSTV